MEPEVLNRIGIILNFLAGFLLAPELLGTKRLEKLENFLERLASKLVDRGNLAKSKVGGLFSYFFFDTRRISFRLPPPSSSLTRKILFWSQITIFIGAIAFWILFIINRRMVYTNLLERISGLLLLAILSIILLTGFVIPILLAMIWVVVGMIVLLARFLISILVGDSKLRTVLVWLGIICFIAGNTLQFIATF